MTVLAGRYELGEVLGEGGMGRVLLARDRTLDRDVAVKLLTATADEAARARFLHEARGTARLHHPNAVAVFDTGEADGQPYIVMELVRGETLADLIAREGSLDIEEATAITLGVLDGLAAAHAAGLVHRDVKPANVLLPTAGGVKLTDFGIAKALDDVSDGLTVAGTVMGTPTYLAPELVDGGPAIPASDLYSVGCMLYLQLTGRPPFTADTPLAVAYAHRNAEVTPAQTLRPDIPDDLAAVLAIALAKDPDDRFADAEAMRTAMVDGPDAVPATPRAWMATDEDTTVPLVTGAPLPPADATDGPGDDEPAPPRGPWLVFTLVALVLAALVAVIVILGSNGTPDPADDPVADPSPDTATDPDDAETAEEVDGTDPAGGAPTPADLNELVALLATTPPETYGQAQVDLLDELLELISVTDPDERSDAIDDLREDVATWLGDRELDPAIAEVTLDLLDADQAESEPSDPPPADPEPSEPAPAEPAPEPAPAEPAPSEPAPSDPKPSDGPGPPGSSGPPGQDGNPNSGGPDR